MNVTSRRLTCQIPSSTKVCEGGLGKRRVKNKPDLDYDGGTTCLTHVT
jgi:hypothetical protein